jgi:hypothetical protein
MMNADVTRCQLSYVIEKMINKTVVTTGTMTSHPDQACVYVMDLMSVHPRARGFRRGFLEHPFGYLSPGIDQLLVRIDLVHFGLSSVKMIDLSTINPTYGGYSGGFVDNVYACYT